MYLSRVHYGPSHPEVDARRLLIMETRKCHACDGTTIFETLTRCPNYDSPTYGRPCPTPGCGSRNRFSHRYIGSVRRPCPACNATGTVPETLYDYIPNHIWETLPMRVYDRATRPLNWVEAYIGPLDGVFSVVDYGAHSKRTDDELIAEVRRHTTHQAIKIAQPYPDADDPLQRERGILCNHIAIIRRRDGYTVEAAFEQPAVTPTEPKPSEVCECFGIFNGRGFCSNCGSEQPAPLTAQMDREPIPNA